MIRKRNIGYLMKPPLYMELGTYCKNRFCIMY
ncbi:hypothetical protein MPF_1141 [Methanohalophilus portucalensis FDF-1]|uniref:Uncharacterized protein n=1 Tax=Methanohalophilus portucalensis FDF-1 TaxID=523843 RepID=A0A1L9C401_9EURY|nr:hypothetical protein MPF_1141 [Methanohalophilus portucalensis FDF-1]